jgi:hypothetical protein
MIPMAISLAFGVIFASLITLFLVPSLYLMLRDAEVLWRRAFVPKHPEWEKSAVRQR